MFRIVRSLRGEKRFWGSHFEDRRPAGSRRRGGRSMKRIAAWEREPHRAKLYDTLKGARCAAARLLDQMPSYEFDGDQRPDVFVEEIDDAAVLARHEVT